MHEKASKVMHLYLKQIQRGITMGCFDKLSMTIEGAASEAKVCILKNKIKATGC